jgi:Protein of unknown function (DUF2541)
MKALAPKLGVAVAALATVLATSAHAQRGPGRGPGRDQVVLLGSVKLSPVADSDTIRVNSCSDSDVQRVAAIRIRAAKHSSNLQQIELTYANSNRDIVDIRGTLRAGDSTQWIDLSGRARCVRSIRVIGSSASIGFKKSVVEIYGVKRDRTDRDRDDRRDDDRRDDRDRDDRGRDDRGGDDRGRGPWPR